jgi:hypothetical protein
MARCPECNGFMKEGNDKCGKCKWINCSSCDKFILKDKGYTKCYTCNTKKPKKIFPVFD